MRDPFRGKFGWSLAVQKRHGTAFTLVELLVVIGIIALLVSLLLPSLVKAKEASRRVACAAKLKQIVLAAQLHASDHQGYFPVMGALPGSLPIDLDDAYSTKYFYLPPSVQAPQITPAPITFSLGVNMSNHRLLNSSDNAVLSATETDSQGIIKNFLCPSQASSVDELIQKTPLLFVCHYSPGDLLPYVDYAEASSYIYNKAILGWADTKTSGRLRGKVSLIHQPARTMFAADGLQGNLAAAAPRLLPVGSRAMLSLYNINQYPPVTLADAFTKDGLAGDPDNFDLKRHSGKINVVCCDGHVETRNITATDLTQLFLLAP
jgi:prepilin-type processing-associated H-X9-DG protein